MIEYNGVTVDYEYRRGQMDLKSVCAAHNINSKSYAKCSATAKSFFVDACAYFKAKKSGTNSIRQQTSLYCGAADNYIAQYITGGDVARDTVTVKQLTPTELSRVEKLREECSLLTLEAKYTPDDYNRRQRNKVCSEYNSLK